MHQMDLDEKERERGVSAYLNYKLKDFMDEWQQKWLEFMGENNYTQTFEFTPNMPEEIYDKLMIELNGGEVDWTVPEETIEEA